MNERKYMLKEKLTKINYLILILLVPHLVLFLARTLRLTNTFISNRLFQFDRVERQKRNIRDATQYQLEKERKKEKQNSIQGNRENFTGTTNEYNTTYRQILTNQSCNWGKDITDLNEDCGH